MEDIRIKFAEQIPEAELLCQEPMKKHTTFRIGGPAEYLALPASEKAIRDIFAFCKKEQLAVTVIGNGSNLLVSDRGIRGMVLQIYKNYHEIRVEENRIIAQAGASLASLARAALEAGLTGLEFASGIPGTLGGAVVMNAGAYGGEMKQVLKTVRVLTPQLTIRTLDAEELELGYRSSCIARCGYTVLGAELILSPGDPEQIRAYMDQLKEQRTSKQPLDLPSAGSTFKRPEGYFAGKLIMDAGLRGYACGGAMISEKHCGFVVNRGDATAEDVLSLLRHVQQVVWEKDGVYLEPEIRFLGEFPKTDFLTREMLLEKGE